MLQNEKKMSSSYKTTNVSDAPMYQGFLRMCVLSSMELF